MKMKIFGLCLALSIGLAFSGCASKNLRSDGTVSQKEIDEGLASSDLNRAMGLRTINFEFDSTSLSANEQLDLENNHRILKNYPKMRIQIEGHCDERGGIQYNLALGERRASALKEALVRMGINPSRIETISLGKEQPISDEHAKNRRGNFQITKI